jgi:hypothetical protein
MLDGLDTYIDESDESKGTNTSPYTISSIYPGFVGDCELTVFSFVIVVFVGGVERREILGDDLGGVSCGIDGCCMAWEWLFFSYSL